MGNACAQEKAGEEETAQDKEKIQPGIWEGTMIVVLWRPWDSLFSEAKLSNISSR